ncbi:hypothetical protein M413DRAFT_13051 [Hebeloma cylindrosporum]|uniref:Uncharacterized protein n=1 Tax=Hebeloma cylindrosporum TaxID=76867 RepID=A0A0C2XJ35_HEBCY|nr:hypothetical protein M413DRAFT_13051 [Hebeloma cylindrosporum h7]
MSPQPKHNDRPVDVTALPSMAIVASLPPSPPTSFWCCGECAVPMKTSTNQPFVFGVLAMDAFGADYNWQIVIWRFGFFEISVVPMDAAEYMRTVQFGVTREKVVDRLSQVINPLLQPPEPGHVIAVGGA